MSLCVVIVSYRTGPALHACLDSLRNAAGVDDIALVDNGNAEAETQAIAAFAASDPRVRVLRGHGNIGFAAGCNTGGGSARTELLVFANPDVVFEPDAFVRLQAALAAAPPPAIVGGDLRDHRGRPERGSRRERLTLWRAFVYASGLAKLEPILPFFRDFNRHRDPMPSAPVRVAAVSGALLAMRRADFLEMRGFDDRYFVHVEDLDMCRRAELKGWPVLFAPGPHGMHARSTSAADPKLIAHYKAYGMARYLNKFAEGPIERGLAKLAGAILKAIYR